MRLEIDIAEHHYNNIMALDSVSLGRVPYKGIIMYSINAIKHGKVLAQEPTKNNLGVDLISRSDALDCVNWGYSFSDIYKKINELPSVTPLLSSELEKNSQKLEKNFGELDCIDRAELLKAMDTWDKFGYTETGCFVRKPKGDYVPYVHYEDMVNCVKNMSSVTPQEPKTGHWTDDGYCSCCNKQTLPLDISGYASGYDSFCPNCGAKMVEPQESEDKE